METIRVNDKFQRFSAQWTPHIISELNGQYVKLAKAAGEFVWHDHAEEDELFFVFKALYILISETSPPNRSAPVKCSSSPRA